jgi:hypothetical protein
MFFFCFSASTIDLKMDEEINLVKGKFSIIIIVKKLIFIYWKLREWRPQGQKTERWPDWIKTSKTGLIILQFQREKTFLLIPFHEILSFRVFSVLNLPISLKKFSNKFSQC